MTASGCRKTPLTQHQIPGNLLVELKILVACEFSGAVREAFRALGHDAWSCDLLPADDGSLFHYQQDVLPLLPLGWDMLIAFPPCTYLCSSGLHWNKRRPERAKQTEAALEFVRALLDAPIPRIALENPVGCISTRIRKPDCVIQPWQHGHPESKTTCLWLKNLPALVPSNVLALPSSGRWDNMTPSGQNRLGPSPDRWKLRSKTYEGIAKAMANTWGGPGATSPLVAPVPLNEPGPGSPGPGSPGPGVPPEPEQLSLFDLKG